MILNTKVPGAYECEVFDADTGEKIYLVVSLDSDTGIIERGVCVDGRHQMSEDRQNFVHIEERRNFRVIHKTSGQLVCQHPR